MRRLKKKHGKTMEHKSYLTLVINLCVFVGATGGQSVHQYIFSVIAASKPFAREWSLTTLYGWKKQFWKTYISVSQRSVPNKAMKINSAVLKITSFWVFWFLNYQFYSLGNCLANYLEIILTCIWTFMRSIYIPNT